MSTLAADAALAAKLCTAGNLDGLGLAWGEAMHGLFAAREWLIDVTTFELNRPALLRGGVDPAWAERYNREFYRLNPASAKVRARCRLPGPWTERFASLCAAPLVESEFYRLYMQPQRHRHSLIGAMPLAQVPSAPTVIALLVRYDDQADFTAEDLQRLTLLLPSLAWAVHDCMRQSDAWTMAVVQHAFGLSPKLAETALLISKGLPNKDIAAALAISLGTAKHYVHQVYERTGASSRADLCRLILG